MLGKDNDYLKHFAPDVIVVSEEIVAEEANVVWGPSFGQSEGDDASSFDVEPAIDLESVDLVGSLGAVVALALASVNVDYSNNLSASAAIDLIEVNLNGDLSVSVAVDGSIFVEGMEADQDTYLDLANPNTANGSATVLLAKNNTIIIDDDKNVYIAWDFTDFSTGTVTDLELQLAMAEDAVVGGDTARIEIYTNATQPFDESTATWNDDEQPPGTLRETVDVAVDGATLGQYFITLGADTRNNMLGNWLYARVIGTADGLGVVTISVASSENSSGAFRPQLEFTVDL